MCGFLFVLYLLSHSKSSDPNKLIRIISLNKMRMYRGSVCISFPKISVFLGKTYTSKKFPNISNRVKLFFSQVQLLQKETWKLS